MFRATVLSIVLIFAAGPSASLVCRSWCDPQAAAATGCHHQDDAGSTSVAGGQTCQDVVLGRSAVVKEDLRRFASMAAPGSITVVTVLPFTPSAWHQRGTDAYRHPTPDHKRPLTVPLRI